MKFKAGTDARRAGGGDGAGPGADRRAAVSGGSAIWPCSASTRRRRSLPSPSGWRVSRRWSTSQPNHLIRLSSTPNDPGLSRQWNSQRDRCAAGLGHQPGAADVLVAVIDSGVTTLTGNGQLPAVDRRAVRDGRRPLPRQSRPRRVAVRRRPSTPRSRVWSISGVATQPVFDTDGHGTHVAGTILQATNNSLGFAGIAYGARLMSVKSCFSYWDLQFFVSALGEPGFVPPSFDGGMCHRRRRRRASGPPPTPAPRSSTSASAVLARRRPIPTPSNYAVQRGAFVAIAVGNELRGRQPDRVSRRLRRRRSPASMSVGAVGRSLRRAFYSNTGSSPRNRRAGRRPPRRRQQRSDLPDRACSSQTSIRRRSSARASTAMPTRAKQGTSMASPHVAGLAALLYSQGVTSPAAIEAALKQFARDLGDPGTDAQYGAGLDRRARDAARTGDRAMTRLLRRGRHGVVHERGHAVAGRRARPKCLRRTARWSSPTASDLPAARRDAHAAAHPGRWAALDVAGQEGRLVPGDLRGRAARPPHRMDRGAIRAHAPGRHTRRNARGRPAGTASRSRPARPARRRRPSRRARRRRSACGRSAAARSPGCRPARASTPSPAPTSSGRTAAGSRSPTCGAACSSKAAMRTRHRRRRARLRRRRRGVPARHPAAGDDDAGRRGRSAGASDATA